ncbi:MAG TPA: 2-amino-3-ketobutyrate CoA ligase [Parabacteroides distasonis]|nr:2-amino-3-ketobutyrate CoA ligase [Parabacteroides distasonis]HCK56868.1 2-amino-3-ketobutyrate CoA ligase [Parabacteroides distasonis]
MDYQKASLKDFENIGQPIRQRARDFFLYSSYMTENRQNNYRLALESGTGASITLNQENDFGKNDFIGFISNDYLGFSHHPKVLEAGREALYKYGAGAGASPLIGGLLGIHQSLEHKIASFFGREDAITFTSGFGTNAGVLSTLLGQSDLAILDMFVHASVIAGCSKTNVKRFLHNDIASLEHILETTSNKYTNKVIVVDGVYSQDGDIAPLNEICKLSKNYNAFLIVDDAHGIGIWGDTGRGVLESFSALGLVDLITGTFSKTFGSVGGYAVGNKEVINLLKYFAAENIFSAAATPQSAGSIIKAIDLIDEEPFWRSRIWENIIHFRKGLESIGIDFGKSNSAIFPIMIRDNERAMKIAEFLYQNGVFVNPILYPAVPKKQSRLRMSVLAVHTIEQLDKTLNLLEWAFKKQ